MTSLLLQLLAPPNRTPLCMVAWALSPRVNFTSVLGGSAAALPTPLCAKPYSSSCVAAGTSCTPSCSCRTRCSCRCCIALSRIDSTGHRTICLRTFAVAWSHWVLTTLPCVLRITSKTSTITALLLTVCCRTAYSSLNLCCGRDVRGSLSKASLVFSSRLRSRRRCRPTFCFLGATRGSRAGGSRADAGRAPVGTPVESRPQTPGSSGRLAN